MDSNHDYTIVTPDTFIDAYGVIRGADMVAVDLETNSLNPMLHGSFITGIAMSVMKSNHKDTSNYYFPINHNSGLNIGERQIEGVHSLLLSPVPQLYWNCAFDVGYLHAMGYPYGNRVRDVMLGLHLLDENLNNYQLKHNARLVYGHDNVTEDTLLEQKLASMGYTKDKMHMLPVEDVAYYAMDDTRLTLQLGLRYAPSLKHAGLYELWKSVSEYAVVLSHLQLRGMKIDFDECERRIAEAETAYEETLAVLQDKFGSDFNPNSPAKVQKALGIAGSTKEEVLEDLLRKGVEDAYLILTARRWKKTVSTYYTPFLNYADDEGILYPNLKQHGTITGRPSCSKPNLLAIPRKGDKDEKGVLLPKTRVKSVFVPREGYKLVQIDYKQAEIYVATHYARATQMAEYLMNDLDIHQQTADLINKPRSFAKSVNFSIIYGIGARALSGDLKISVSEAAQILRDYNNVHPQYMELYRNMEKVAQSELHIRLFTGRRIRYDTRRYPDYHKASSNLVQGTVAEIIRLAMIDIHKTFSSYDVHQLLQVYDSDILEVPEDKLWLLPAIVQNMTYTKPHLDLWIPLKADVEIGDRWSNLEEYTI